jgi:hypothetical protein
MSEFEVLKEKAAQMEALVEHWFFETFHGSLVARSTEVWNAVHDAKEDLKRRLAGFVADLSQDPKKD